MPGSIWVERCLLSDLGNWDIRIGRWRCASQFSKLKVLAERHRAPLAHHVAWMQLTVNINVSRALATMLEA